MNTSASMVRLMDDPNFSTLKRLVIECTGLAYYKDKDADFAARIASRMTKVGLSTCTEYLRLLTSDEKGKEERHLLIGQLTIGETYFFRHAEQFDGLREIVFPALLQSNASRRSLRIWSAGCSTGAEPYSIAILLKQEFGALLRNWDVKILATDINHEFLSRAQRGWFEDWAMRSTPESIKRRWFVHADNGWMVVPECRGWITFQYHNLVEHSFPSVSLVAQDLIVCRNVMIYFDRSRIERLLREFHDCLSEEAWLVVGHGIVKTNLSTRVRGA